MILFWVCHLDPGTPTETISISHEKQALFALSLKINISCGRIIGDRDWGWRTMTHSKGKRGNEFQGIVSFIRAKYISFFHPANNYWTPTMCPVLFQVLEFTLVNKLQCSEDSSVRGWVTVSQYVHFGVVVLILQRPIPLEGCFRHR